MPTVPSKDPEPLQELRDDQIVRPPEKVRDKIKRGRDRLKDYSAKRNECWEFWRGNQYVWLNQENVLVQQATTTSVTGQGKPGHRVRTVRNMIQDVVRHEVSAATQRVPSYDVSPATTDPEDIGAARLSEKVALFGYDKWRLRAVTVDAVTSCVVADEAFAWPWFDTSKGKLVDEETGVCEGEVAVRVYTANECYWEPGARFEDSPWHAVEQARPREELYTDGEFLGGKLKDDARTSDVIGTGQPQGSRMVMVTEYLERPTSKNPDGLWLTIANDRVIKKPRRYPCDDDWPVLHKLCYSVDPDKDRDQGLVRHLIDPQRTVNDCISKAVEWKNLALNPQVILNNMKLNQRLTDEPGAVFEVWGSGQVAWRPVPPIPRELFEMKQQAENDIARISAQNIIPDQVQAARAVQALIERDQNARADFIANLADWHSRVMRACLYLVQKHYTEKRMLNIKGRFGPETLADFRGAQLRDQIDVTVLPGSIEPRTRSSIEQKVFAFADRGWVSPEAAMAAINGGTAESLIEDYELDVAWANHCIQQVQKFGGHPELAGQIRPPLEQMVRPFDNSKVQLHVIQSFAKTQDYSMSAPPVQEAVMTLVEMHEQHIAEQQAQEQQAQMMQAQQQGMGNAARPSGPPQRANQPMPSPEGGNGQLQRFNQPAPGA